VEDWVCKHGAQMPVDGSSADTTIYRYEL